MTTIDLDQITLKSGGHSSPEAGMCLLEAVAYVAGEPFSDHPACTSPVLGAFGRSLNDVLRHDKRQALRQYIPAMIGTAGDGLDEARSYIALDWLIRTWMPTFLALHESTREHANAARALPPIVDMATAKQAGVVVRAAREAAREAAGEAAARAAAAAAAWEAAWEAAWAAAWEAAWEAAAAAAAAWEAARAAAGEFLAPTVSKLQDSAIALMPVLIAGGRTSPNSETPTP